MTPPPLHPLPIGMRDLLPEEARARRELTHALAGACSLHGYDPVVPPAFELLETLERGLGREGSGDVLCFVEPESGEIAALRPDVTPQIARMVATRLLGEPAPYRLFYEATVVRRRAGRARPHRQIPQFGAELVGVAGAAGEIELLTLLGAALREVGLARFALDLQDTRIVRALLEGLPPAARAEATAALGARDARAARAAAGSSAARDAIGALPALVGGDEALAEARRVLAGTAAAPHVEELASLHGALVRRGAAPRVAVDLGEVRHFEYYTGVVFHAVAPGPGEPVAAGGRYDDLLGRFGAPMPAVGFGVVLDALAQALPAAARRLEPRVLTAGPRGEERARALRAGGVPCALAPAGGDPLAYARAWSFALVVDDALVDVATGVSSPIGEDPAAAARAALAAAARAK